MKNTVFRAASGALLAAVTMAGLMPLQVSAQPLASETVILDSATGTSPCGHAMGLPPIMLMPGSPLQIKALNFTPQPLTVAIPDLNVNQVVPPNSEEVIKVSSTATAGLTPGQSIAYYVTDASGDHIASSTITGEQSIVAMMSVSSQMSTAQTMTEPQAPAPKPQKRSAVRGYW